MGKSSKENIIPTKYMNEEKFAGGVLAAANHIAGFCKDVHLVTCLGNQNNYSDFIKRHLKPNIKTKFFYRDDAPTTVKRRFVEPAFLAKLFEICFMDDRPLPEKIEKSIYTYLEAIIEKFDLVLVADFGHGLIGPKLVRLLEKKSRFLAINAQTNSANAGFNLVTKYKKADYVCIDEPEMRLASHNRFADIENIILKMTKQFGYKKVIVTLGHKGSVGYTSKEKFSTVPVFSREIIDRVGAGDAFLSITAPCACMGYPMEVIGFIGNAVGAMKVLIVGNRASVEPVPLFKFINTLLK
jgi:sugar/nucleoside kinase (ribokinase family)